MKICFVDSTPFQYDFDSLYSENLRGAETIIINLSKALNDIGCDITIINNCKNSTINNNIKWININTINKINKFDLVIANGDCRLFNFALSTKKVLFSHSNQSIEKFLRKKQFLSFIKHKPKVCFLSEYHKKNRSTLLKIFGSIDLRWSVDSIFQKAKISKNIDDNLAIFTSRPDRNLKILIDIWTNYIINKNNKLKLLVTENNYKNLDNSIISRKLGNQNKLLNDMQKSKICLIPGHKAELFCLAAEEAKELCIPIVTLGIGCLSEKVEHNKNGFIANNYKDFANYTFRLFNDDNLWSSMRNYMKSQRGKNTWKNVAKQLIDQVQ